MNFFQKLIGGKKQGGSGKPDWAEFMGEGEFEAFRKKLTARIHRRNPKAHIDWEKGMWSTGGAASPWFGMMNLAQMCHGTPEGGWDEAIEGFFQALDGAGRVSDDISFEDAKRILKVRLYPLDMPMGDFATAPYCDSFTSALCLDYPDAVKTFRRDFAEKWGVPLHELFEIGLKNVMEQEPVERLDTPGPLTDLRFFAGESFFTASHVLRLDRYCDFDDEKGCIAIAPYRHFFGCHPVDAKIATVVPIMSMTAHEQFQKGPGSITPDVLWFRRGQFEKIELKAEGENVMLDGPEEFVKLVQSLG